MAVGDIIANAAGDVLRMGEDGHWAPVSGKGKSSPPPAETPPPAEAAPPSRPRRGDELTQPDPTPSAPITAPTPKPMLDVTGSVARNQSEIRKGAPGEDVQAAEDRAHATEEQGNPVKDDWIAKEAISTAAAGPLVGKAVEIGGGLLRRGLGAISESTAVREAGRALERIATGAKSKAREALGEVAPEAKAMLKEKPWLAKGKTSADLAQNFAAEGKSLAARRAELLDLADARAMSRSAVPEAVEGEETAQMSTPNFRPLASEPNVSGETGYVPPGGKVTATSENATQRITAGPAAEGAPVEAAPPAGAGAPLSLVEQKIDGRIAKLAKGTRGDREAAEALKAKKAELLSAHQEAGAMPASKIRQEMSDYQSVYDKNASTASAAADKEMSKALGDALRSHVDDPELMSKIDALTDEMSVTTRAEKALKGKAKTEAAPGGPPSHGFVKQVAHDAMHSHNGSGSVGLAMRTGKRILSPAASAADRALGGMARRMDPAIAAVVERGAMEHWSAARLAREIANVQPAAAAGLPSGLTSKTSIQGDYGGLVEPGNVDLTNRPDVANADGSHSSVRSMSFQDQKGGPEILVPTVSDDGRIMSDDEAIENYHRTGKFLGKFKTPDDATAYASKLHEQQEAQMHK